MLQIGPDGLWARFQIMKTVEQCSVFCFFSQPVFWLPIEILAAIQTFALFFMSQHGCKLEGLEELLEQGSCPHIHVIN